MSLWALARATVLHKYTSTACFHGLHESCRRVCKFCGKPCRCKCHKGRHAEQSREPAAQAADFRAALEQIATPSGPILTEAQQIARAALNPESTLEGA